MELLIAPVLLCLASALLYCLLTCALTRFYALTKFWQAIFMHQSQAARRPDSVSIIVGLHVEDIYSYAAACWSVERVVVHLPTSPAPSQLRFALQKRSILCSVCEVQSKISVRARARSWSLPSQLHFALWMRSITCSVYEVRLHFLKSNGFGMMWRVLYINLDWSLRFVRVYGTEHRQTENCCQLSFS